MVKIKGWEKFQDSTNITRWRNLIRRSIEVRVAGATKYTEPIGKWFVEISGRPTIFYDNRKKAMDKAIDYIKKHPRG